MALVTVGNTHIGNEYLTECEVDVTGEDGYDYPVYLQGEREIVYGLLIEHTFEKGSYENYITIYFYYLKPTSDYWVENMDVYCKGFLPFVIGGSGECLNKSYDKSDFLDKSSGWYSFKVELERNIYPGENCIIGYCGEFGTSKWDISNNPVSVNYDFHRYMRISEIVEHLKNDTLRPLLEYPSPYGTNINFSFYFTYYDAPLSCDYKTNVGSNFLVNSKINNISNFFRFGTSISFLINDTVPGRNINYIRFQNHKAKYKAENKHLGIYFRDPNTNFKTKSVIVSSRLLNRFCSTIISFWDFLRGKIRETPNVVTLFCPVDLELEIESRI